MPGRLWARSSRSPSPGVDAEIPASNGVPAEVPGTPTKKGRGRPPTTGQYVGLWAAKKAASEAERQQEESRAQKEAGLENRRRARAAIAARTPEKGSTLNVRRETAQGLQTQITGALTDISDVAKVSKGLKGTCVSKLKKAVAAIEEIAEEFLNRTTDDEIIRLRACNKRLETEVRDLSNEVAKMRLELAEARLHHPVIATIPAENSVFAKNQPPAWLQDLIAEIRSCASSPTIKEPGIITVSKDKVLPTQHSMIRPATTLPATTQPSTIQPPASLPSTSKGSKSKNVKTPTPDASNTNPSAPVASTTQPTIPQEEGWTMVTKKKKKGKKKTKGNSKQAAQPTRGTQASRKKPQKKPVATQLKQPHAQAVVIKLHPEAEKRGITYAEVIAEAKKKINLADLGITSIRFRRAATGARILEVPGTTSGAKADSLAQKIRENLNADDVRITRPTKCARLRVSELDDSVTIEELTAAIARVAECPVEQVRCTPIRLGFDGAGSTVVTCPVAGAKKLVGHRLLVGWTSAHAKILSEVTMRCYRCFGDGHVASNCKGQADRSNLCFRCGQEGHRARSCTNKPRCVRCEADGKKANHQLGGKICFKEDKKGQKKDANKSASGQPQPTEKTDTTNN